MRSAHPAPLSVGAAGRPAASLGSKPDLPPILLIFFLGWACLTLPATPARGFLDDDPGYLQAQNLLEYQVGRDPTGEQEDLTKLFDQILLDYQRRQLRLGLRFEFFRDSVEQPFGKTDYSEIAQKYVEWSDPALSVRIGNGYAILGRGLLFRAFELPGIIRDANFPRSRFAESRDLEGVIINGRKERFSLTAFSGRPVTEPNNPPGAEEEFIFRRSGTVSGGQIGLDLGRGIQLGAAYQRNDDIAKEGTEELGAGNLEIRFPRLLPPLTRGGIDLRFYGEYAARSWLPLEHGLDTRDGSPHALYTATELAFGRWGVSFETKSYHQFNLKVNDPPNLVPEFSYHLLNRMSHFLLPHDEKGHQLASEGSLPGGIILQTTWAEAVNRADDGFGNFSGARQYSLYFLGLESPPTHATRLVFFAAAGQNEIEGITDHTVLGHRLELSHASGWGSTLDLQYRVAERRISTPLLDEQQSFHNIFGAFGLTKAGFGSLALQGEFSSDPLEEDDPFTPEIETESRVWYGVVGNWQINAHHEATIFAGDRRGGTACTSGTCYEVPDFSGIELRVVSRY